MDRLKGELKKIMARFPGYGFRFRYLDWETDFLRFYRSQANYNISKRTVVLNGTVEREKRKFSFQIADPDGAKATAMVERAVSLLNDLPPDPDFTSFEDDPTQYDYHGFVKAADSAPLSRKLDILEQAAAAAGPLGFDIYGTFITVNSDGFLLQSNGLDKRIFVSPLMLDMKAVKRDTGVTVINSFGGTSLDGLDPAAFMAELARKMKWATLPITDVAPGDYTVILGPQAVHTFLSYLLSAAYGQALDGGVSFFEGKEGKPLFPPALTVASRPDHPQLIPFPYNGDGHIARPLSFIDKGVFRDFVMNHYYAHKLNRPKNGSVGVAALVMEPGSEPLEQMIAGVDRGLYIANLHYMNFINRKETSVTGLTRDGTFLIEKGKVVKVVNNLRYTVKISSVFENLAAVGSDQQVVPNSDNYFEFDISAGLVPHILTKGFKISSSTRTI
ncbi:MAG TPA: metallopeptidase TldD-related protein [bacterium]|nr:metallopeptidase TldD-related protein [bacterium]